MQTYVVGFNIFDARALVTPDGQPCDPFVLVECCDNEYQTETKQGKQSIVTYNESFIWSSIQLYPQQFKAASITFSVYSRNFFTRNDLIGRATLQLDNVRNRRNHVYAKKWMTITKDNEPAASGALCATVFCLAPGDVAPSVDQQEGNDDAGEEGGGGEQDDYEDLSKAVLGGSIDQSGGKPHHVMVTIHRVEDLAPGSNPFVTAEFAGSLVTTSVAKDVTQHTFNECLTMPAMTPLFEDILLIKLWNHVSFGADELFAQGMLSFSELRNRSLLPRWFNFYGYNPDEILDSDVKEIAEQGEEVEANWYKGKLLVSARVEKLTSLEDLQSAGVSMAKGFEEPATTSICILADIYMVAGAVGREVQVEITLGTQSAETGWVYPSFGAGSDPASSSSASSAQQVEQDFEHPTTFQYTQSEGRPAVILALMPEDPISQPDCLINVYSRGVMSGRTRLGYCKVPLAKLEKYDPGNPRIPFFLPLKPMPWNGMQKLPVSLLMTLEKTSDESSTNNRHNRKIVKNMAYVLRVYLFGARHIDFGGNQTNPALFVRATCAGASTETGQIAGDLRPQWMRCMELHITLMTDHPKRPPTMEPITVSLCNYEGMFSQPVIGKAICKYTYMRQKDILDEWEPYRLAPQWVKLYGGQYNTKPTGEICCAFELLRKKDVPELPQARMWPREDLLFQRNLDFCRLRKATLHVSVLGLRDMKPLPVFGGLSSAPVSMPTVEFKVRKLLENPRTTKTGKTIHEFWSCFCKYIADKPKGDPNNPADRNKKWETKVGMNHEFFQYRRMNIMLPEDPVFQPWVTIKVGDGPTGGVTDIAECRLNLGPLLPWLTGKWERGPALESFVEMDEETRNLHIGEIRKSELAQSTSKNTNLIAPPKKVEETMDSSGVHILMRKAAKEISAKGFPVKTAALNMKLGHGHGRPQVLTGDHANSPSRLNRDPVAGLLDTSMRDRNDIFLRATGEIQRAGGSGGATRGDLEGRLEDSGTAPFVNDFFYKSLPLTRNRDVITQTDMEARYDPGTFGFIKCAIKLTEGHLDEIIGDNIHGIEYESSASSSAGASNEQAPNDGANSSAESSSSSAEAGAAAGQVAVRADGASSSSKNPQEVGEDAGGGEALPTSPTAGLKNLDPVSGRRQSHGISPILDGFAWDEDALRERYKSSERVPNRVRARLYFVKGICIYGKASGFANPYLEFTLGKAIFVSMRNMFCSNTNTPTFYRLEERDIRMPEDSQLEIELKDHPADAVIGSTCIDLEDRWHSDTWRSLEMVPSENRGLWTLENVGMSRGSLNCWVELLDSVKSSEQKASTLRAPPAQEIEIRVVIWDTKAIRIVDDDHTDVTLTANLDCAEYFGEYPSIQDTDVHYGSKSGDAVFNWRVVYPHIRMPTKSCTLQISVFDYNMMSGNVFIADVNLDLKKYLEKVARDMDSIEVNSDLEFKNASFTEENPDVGLGSVNISMWVLTQSEADAMPVGLARNEPNVNPQLITPLEGRGWGDVLGGFSFKMPNFGLLGKLMPVIIVSFAMMIGFRYIGLL
ncbi:unnamed protein product [Amoebophrya sp. A120]|nr:unnamed protein product [Amoebophrya sp. A120]|eukprot:GSA120T00017865001.1